MILVSEFKAENFEELFDNIYKISWHDYIPKNGRFDVAKVSSVRSKLFSVRDIQSITKKAIATKLGNIYNLSILDETGANYPIRITILKDIVSVMIDSSGNSLHKRGYRTRVSKAPLSETLAAALIMLSLIRVTDCLLIHFVGVQRFL